MCRLVFLSYFQKYQGTFVLHGVLNLFSSNIENLLMTEYHLNGYDNINKLYIYT